MLEGTVIGQCEPRHRHSEFIAFMERVERSVPKKQREIHLILLILDNYATHTHPKVREWFAAHPRYQLHFTPTSSSWINLGETWFGILTAQAVRRGSFESMRALAAAIERFIRSWNDGAAPFL